MTISVRCAFDRLGGQQRGLERFVVSPITRSIVQREIWDGEVRLVYLRLLCPDRGRAVPVDGGYVLNGALGRSPVVATAQVGRGSARSSLRLDAKPPHEGAFFLLPIGDCEIVDTGFVNGLAGTGSKRYRRA